MSASHSAQPSLVDPVDPERLRSLLGGDSLWQSVEVVEATGSTNADLATAARSGAEQGRVLISGFQSGGRGRLNRSWTAPPGTSLAMSVLLRPTRVMQSWSWLPLLAGLAVGDGLRRAAGVDAVLKWPNDVLVGGRKICGVLAERVDYPTGASGCVIGMGINTELAAEQLPVPTATSLALVGATNRNQTDVAAAVLQALEVIYRQWERADDTASARYRSRCDTVGRDVRVELGPGESVTGRAETIDPSGRLVVRTASGARSFSAGDVVHLR